MDRRTVELGSWFGIPVGIDPSWFLVFALFTWTLAIAWFPERFPDWPAAVTWLAAALTTLALFGSVLIHELAHSLVAVRSGVPVRRITLHVFGGVSQLTREPDRPGDALRIAAVGPAVNLVLAVVLLGAARLLGEFPVVTSILSYLALINLMLGLFNLLPGFPLDGGNVVRALLWARTRDLHRATLVAANAGRGLAFVMIFGGVWLVFSGFLLDGLWISFIGWFLDSAAVAQLHRERLHEVLAAHLVAEAMDTDLVEVPSEATLGDVAEWGALGRRGRTLLVVEAGRLVGVVPAVRTRAVPEAAWPSTPVGALMVPAEGVGSVDADTDLWAALHLLEEEEVPLLVARDLGGRPVGVLDEATVLAFVRSTGPAPTAQV